MDFKTITPKNLLGRLNDIEAKNALGQLFVRGDTSLFKRYMSVSIIGSRKASEEGIKRARTLTRAIVSRGGMVVCGLAEGIDTAVHKTAIEMGGKTVAVIGTAINQVYPRKNKDLQDQIAQDHLIISQFPVGSYIKPYNFVLRNKTMALVSDATVIVEAGEKSGTIHQGWEAIRLGRPLFLMESLATNEHLSWPKELIKYGAEILTKDLLDQFFDLLPSGGRGGDELTNFF